MSIETMARPSGRILAAYLAFSLLSFLSDGKARAQDEFAPTTIHPNVDFPRIESVVYGSMYWIDNDRVLMSVNDLPGLWVKREGEQSKVVVLNTRTKSVEDTAYTGAVVCYAEGRIVIAQNVSGGVQIAGGRFGEPLTNIDIPSKVDPLGAFSGPTCNPIEWGEEFVKTRLRKGDGIIMFSRRRRDQVTLLTDTAEPKATFSTGSAVSHINRDLTYLPVEHIYFMRGNSSAHIASGGVIFKSDGEHELIAQSQFFATLNSFGQGFGENWLGADGAVIWSFVASRNAPQYEGVYVAGSRLTAHLDDHRMVHAAGFSSDGCKFFYQRATPPRRAVGHLDNLEFALLDICHEGDK